MHCGELRSFQCIMEHQDLIILFDSVCREWFSDICSRINGTGVPDVSEISQTEKTGNDMMSVLCELDIRVVGDSGKLYNGCQ